MRITLCTLVQGSGSGNTASYPHTTNTEKKEAMMMMIIIITANKLLIRILYCPKVQLNQGA
jgi:hypothetical protein